MPDILPKNGIGRKAALGGKDFPLFQDFSKGDYMPAHCEWLRDCRMRCFPTHPGLVRSKATHPTCSNLKGGISRLLTIPTLRLCRKVLDYARGVAPPVETRSKVSLAKGCVIFPDVRSVAVSGPSILDIFKPALRTSSRIPESLDSMRLVGPETLRPATIRPRWSNTGAPTQTTPSTFSPRSNATPCSRTASRCSIKCAF